MCDPGADGSRVSSFVGTSESSVCYKTHLTRPHDESQRHRQAIRSHADGVATLPEQSRLRTFARDIRYESISPESNFDSCDPVHRKHTGRAECPTGARWRPVVPLTALADAVPTVGGNGTAESIRSWLVSPSLLIAPRLAVDDLDSVNRSFAGLLGTPDAYESASRYTFASHAKTGSRSCRPVATARPRVTSNQCFPAGVAGQFGVTYSAPGARAFGVV